MKPNASQEQDEKTKNNTKKIYKLQEKQFVLRNSLLTDLFENKHIASIHHMFVATLVNLFINVSVHDFIYSKNSSLGLRLIKLGFANLHVGFMLWLVLFCITCAIFQIFNLWAITRVTQYKNKQFIHLWDRSWIILLVVYYFGSFYYVSKTVQYFQLPPASSAVVIFEHVRFLMKIHSFVRSVAPRVLKCAKLIDLNFQNPKFSKYLYFLFAPTLIYRDEYPRTKSIRWSFVFNRLLEVIGVVFYYSFIVDRLLMPHYGEFGLRKYSWQELLVSIFESTVPGILLLLVTFYMILHSWLNLFAELLRFGDRLFYLDWWTSTSYSEFFRTWNIVVHDWLYTYIYKDCYEYVRPGSKMFAKMCVFVISAIVHEWLLTYFFGFFFPALFIFFLFSGTTLTFINPPKLTILNVLFWYGQAFGGGFLSSLYTLEFVARKNVPVENPDWTDFFIPRSLTCDCFV